MVRYAIILLVLLGLGLWYEHSLWSECLDSHSWFYCLRVIAP